MVETRTPAPATPASVLVSLGAVVQFGEVAMIIGYEIFAIVAKNRK